MMELLEGFPQCEGNLADAADSFIRRSSRNPNLTLLQSSQVQSLLAKIRANDKETVVLKIKDHLSADINCVVVDAILEALFKNRVCQALYIQNLSKAFQHDQLMTLIRLLQKKMIWCLNVGENYEISNADWSYFCDALPSTNVTHLYVSEHVISLDLKNRMRSHIRENRKKHNKHCNIKNLDVISRCTHCWWNPINSIRHAQAMGDKTCLSQQRPKAKLAKWTSTDRDKASSSEPWKFSCRCKEVCSSYEHPRYHPVGRMFQCTKCSTWAHVACILGTSVTDEELEEMGAVLCHMCLTRVQREQRYHSSSSLGPNERKSAAEGPADSWTFRCKCGEYCRSSEKVSVHPVGRSFQCTKCDIWSHVSCVFGDKVSDEDIERMEEALCFSCKCLSRRKRARLELPEDSTLETTA